MRSRIHRWTAVGALLLPLLGMSAHAEAQSKGAKPKPREAGSERGKADDSVRQLLTGDRPDHSTAAPVESPELKAMRALDHELFPPLPSPDSAPWDDALALPAEGPETDVSGLPERAAGASEDAKDKPDDLSWLAGLTKPDFPVRFEPSVVRYLKYYKDNPRGRQMIAGYVRKSGRFKKSIVSLLRKYGMPEDVLWLALVESAFDPTIHSHAGAAGLWQFMPATGRIYGLTVNRRIDERLDPERSTHAALSHLKDLFQRFGTWELAFSAYNMGYGGLLAAVRKYNTNDYWELRRLEAGLPYETALYVPKIMAIAIAANNCKVFGCDSVTPDAPAPFGDEGQAKAAVAPGTTLDDVAEAIELAPDKLAALNPQIIKSRLPPLEHATLPQKAWTVYVPNSKAKVAKDKLPSATSARPLGSHVVRWGETLAAIAHAYETSSGFLEQLNDLYPHESPRPGTTLFVPKGRTPKPDVEIQRALGAVAVVPDHAFDYKDRRRLFYEPIFGDTVEDVARVCGVKPAEIRRWNHLEARANLQEGMRLQLFLHADARPANVLLYEAPHVDPLTVVSERFFSHYEAARGRKRIEVTVAAGDTWKSLSQRYGLSLGSLERINHKSRRSALQAGDKVIVYAKIANLEQAEAARDLQDMAGAQALADAPPSDTAPSDTAPSDTTPSDTTQGDGPLDGAPSDGTAPSGAPQATSGQRLRAGAKRD